MAIPREARRGILWWSGMAVTGVVLGISLQLASAWIGSGSNPPNGNVGGPVNTSSQTQVKTGALGVGGLQTNAFVLQDGTQGAGKVLVSDANGIGHWQALDCKAASCGGANNCIKPDGTCGRIYVRVHVDSSVGNSCDVSADPYSNGNNGRVYSKCYISSGQWGTDGGRHSPPYSWIDAEADVVGCKGNYTTPPKNQGGYACVNSDGTYGWLQVQVRGMTHLDREEWQNVQPADECSVGLTYSPYNWPGGDLTYCPDSGKPCSSGAVYNGYLRSVCGGNYGSGITTSVYSGWTCQ